MDRPRIVGIYLAAGKSSRMGCNKLELPFGNTFLGSLGLQAAIQSRLDWTIAVTRKGDRLHWLAPFSKKMGWSCLRCPENAQGQSSSLKVGVRAAIEMEADAVLIMLADQPFITSKLLNQLIKAFAESPKCAYLARGKTPPVLLSKSVFPDLLKLKGDLGARGLLAGKWKEDGMEIGGGDDVSAIDIDTAEEYEYWKGGWS